MVYYEVSACHSFYFCVILSRVISHRIADLERKNKLIKKAPIDQVGMADAPLDFRGLNKTESDGVDEDKETPEDMYVKFKAAGDFKSLYQLKKPSKYQQKQSMKDWDQGLHPGWNSEFGFPLLYGFDIAGESTLNVVKVRDRINDWRRTTTSCEHSARC